MSIYYSHSISDYNTPYEQACINIIQKQFPYIPIINPKDIALNKTDMNLLKGDYTNYISMMEKHFFPKINFCDTLIAFDDSNGNLTDGVIKEIEYAKKINKTVYIKSKNNWINNNKDFYENSNAYEFIEKYFEVKKGVKCIAVHPKSYSINKALYRLNWADKLVKFYPDYYDTPINSDFKRMRTLSKENLINSKCTHSFMHIFDEKVLNWYSKSHSTLPEESIVGINAVLDLDAPSNGTSRKDIFDSINDFNIAINTISKALDEIDQEYNQMFSGNGVYIILKGYYKKNLIKRYTDNLITLIENLQMYEFDQLKVKLDNARTPWNDYFKIPFTFHEKKPRISCPLPKGELDAKWLNEHTDISKIKDDYSLVDEIIKEANWEILW